MEIKALVTFLLVGFCASSCSAAAYGRQAIHIQQTPYGDFAFNRFMQESRPHQPKRNFLNELSSTEEMFPDEIFPTEHPTTKVAVTKANNTLPPALLEWYSNITTRADENFWDIVMARLGRVTQYPPGISKIREYIDIVKNKTYNFVTGPTYNSVVDELRDAFIKNITPILMTVSLEDMRKLGLMFVKNPEYLERLRTSDAYVKFSEQSRKKDEEMENQIFQKLQEALSDPEINARIRSWFENPSFEALDEFLRE